MPRHTGGAAVSAVSARAADVGERLALRIGRTKTACATRASVAPVATSGPLSTISLIVCYRRVGQYNISRRDVDADVQAATKSIAPGASVAALTAGASRTAASRVAKINIIKDGYVAARLPSSPHSTGAAGSARAASHDVVRQCGADDDQGAAVKRNATPGSLAARPPVGPGLARAARNAVRFLGSLFIIAGAGCPVASRATLAALGHIAADGRRRDGNDTTATEQPAARGRTAAVVDWIRCGADHGVVDARDGVIGNDRRIERRGSSTDPDATASHRGGIVRNGRVVDRERATRAGDRSAIRRRAVLHRDAFQVEEAVIGDGAAETWRESVLDVEVIEGQGAACRDLEDLALPLTGNREGGRTERIGRRVLAGDRDLARDRWKCTRELDGGRVEQVERIKRAGDGDGVRFGESDIHQEIRLGDRVAQGADGVIVGQRREREVGQHEPVFELLLARAGRMPATRGRLPAGPRRMRKRRIGPGTREHGESPVGAGRLCLHDNGRATIRARRPGARALSSR